jgi:hypothetical protein
MDLNISPSKNGERERSLIVGNLWIVGEYRKQCIAIILKNKYVIRQLCFTLNVGN